MPAHSTNSDAPRRAAAGKPAPVRERILNVARDSFYREGIRAVGVDTLIARSGVAKMSFYRSFRSKDELICAYLREEGADYWRRWDKVIAPYADAPRKALPALLAWTAEQSTKPDFRGCPFSNTMVEFPEQAHPARAVIAEFKAERQMRLRKLAKAAGARDLERLADQIGILLEGWVFCAEGARPARRASAFVRAGEILVDAETSPD